MHRWTEAAALRRSAEREGLLWPVVSTAPLVARAAVARDTQKQKTKGVGAAEGGGADRLSKEGVASRLETIASRLPLQRRDLDVGGTTSLLWFFQGRSTP